MKPERETRRFFRIIILAVLLSGLAAPQDASTDLGSLFARAVNSATEPEQNELISRVFSQSAIREAGIDRLLGLVKGSPGFLPVPRQNDYRAAISEPGSAFSWPKRGF
jgi:hypothetical protein